VRRLRRPRRPQGGRDRQAAGHGRGLARDPYFTDAERAALALAEAATRLADRPDPVPDEIWDAAADHYDEKELAAIVLMVAMTNLFNRINVTTRQPAGTRG
jgi:alkylhydroperoxidase family enzyme